MTQSKNDLLARTQINPDIGLKQQSTQIPKFYLPNQKFDEAQLEKDLVDSDEQATIKEHFELGKKELAGDELKPLCSSLLEIPIYFGPLLLKKYNRASQKISMSQFTEVWKTQLKKLAPAARAFNLLDRDNKGHLVAEDFTDLMSIILECHPGLGFLRETDFQQRYGTTG